VAPPATTPATVTQGMAIVSAFDKREALRRLIRSQDVKNALIFCNRKKDVDILYKSLARHGFNVGALHGDMSQPVRMETLERFKLGEIRLLVCSDVAARGLDIDDMSHVFNFDVPFQPEDYVHRIGRTGRAGKSGAAFTLASPEDGRLVAAIERITGQEIPRIQVPDMDAAEFEEEGDDRRRSRGRGRNGRERPRRGRSGPSPQFRDSDHDGTDDLQPPAERSAASAPAAEAPPGEDAGRSRRRGERQRDRRHRTPRGADRGGTDDLQPPAEAAEERREAPARPHRGERRRERDERRHEERRHEERAGGRDRRRERGWDRDDGPPVVGFGDFTPAFLSRPVKPRRRRNGGDEPIADEAA
jgi:superfamily II DNA/RNA helicase